MSKDLLAVALKYLPEENSAPIVVVSGKGEIARFILEIARKYGIKICRNSQLAEQLSNIPTGSPIPSELYQIVAEIFLFLIQTDSSYAKKYSQRLRN